MATSNTPQEPTPASALHVASTDAEAEALFNKGRKLAIPLLAIAIVVVVVAFVNTARQEAVRKANAEAYAELQKAAEFESQFDADEEKTAENRKKQRAIFESVLADYPDTVAAIDTKFRLAALAMKTEDFSKAETLFGELATAGLTPMQTDAALTGKASALMGQKKFDQALQEFKGLAQKKNSTFAVESKYRVAVVAYRQGDFETAKQYLDDVVASDEAGDMKRLAEQFLERLDLFDADTVKASFEPAPPEAKDDDATTPDEPGADGTDDSDPEPAAE